MSILDFHFLDYNVFRILDFFVLDFYVVPSKCLTLRVNVQCVEHERLIERGCNFMENTVFKPAFNDIQLASRLKRKKEEEKGRI